jgi:hypothetical protein
MAEWVWFAGWGRLKHLALMRLSAASTRFARRTALLLGLGLGVFQATQYGWRWVTSSSALDPRFEPQGFGWLHVAAAPPDVVREAPPELAVNLWWSPVQAACAIAIGLVATLLLMWVVLALFQQGVTLAHKHPFRTEQRMTAAIHYGTGWSILLLAGALVASLRPVAYIGEMARWGWYPPQGAFELAAAVVVGFGVVFWWFWLLRLGATAPAPTRVRVVSFFAIGAPLIACGAVAAWYFGLDRLYEYLFAKLTLTF